MKKFLVIFFFVTAFLKLEAGEPDTLWTKSIYSTAGGCNFLKFNYDETKIIAGSPMGIVYILDAVTGNLLDSINSIFPPKSVNPASIYDYAFVNGKNMLAVASSDSLLLVNMDTKLIEQVCKDTTLSTNWPFYNEQIYSVCISGTNSQVAITFGTQHRLDSAGSMLVNIYDISQKNVIKSIILGRGGLPSGSLFSPDGSKLAIYSNKYLNWKSPLNFGVDFYDTKSWVNIGRIKYDSTQANYFTFSPDGSLLISSYDDRSEKYIRIWDVGTHKLKFKITTSINDWTYRIYSYCLSNDSKKILFSLAIGDSTNKFQHHLVIYDLINNDYKYLNDSLFKFLGSPSSIKLNKQNTRLLGTNGGFYLFDLSQVLSAFNQNSISSDIIYPNPTTGIVVFKFFNPTFEEITLSVIESSGNILRNKAIGTFEVGDQTVEENFNNLQAGMYFIRLTGKSFSKTFKLIKEK